MQNIIFNHYFKFSLTSENILLKMHQTRYVLMKDELCQIHNSCTKKNLVLNFQILTIKIGNYQCFDTWLS